MTVLVTGGFGLVGKHLQDICPSWNYVNSSNFDLTDKDQTDYMIRIFRPKTIVHLAADVGGIQYNIDNQPELFSNNILMNTNVLTSAARYDIKVLGMLSTCIYPSTSEYPMTEDLINTGDPQESNLGYALSKRMMLEHMNLLNSKYETKHCCLIPSNLYGKYADFDLATGHFVSVLLEKIRIQAKEFTNNRGITIWGDGTPLRQFTYAGDLAKIIQIFVGRNIFKTVNVASPENLSIEDIAKTAINSLCPDIKIHYDKSKPNGQFRKDVSSDMLNKLLGYKFKYTPLKDGMKIVYDKIIS